MKKYLILLFTLFSISLLSTQAQNRHGGNQGQRKFDKEAFVKKRTDFFTKELELTNEEVKNFIPLFNEFMEKKFEISREARRARNKIKTSNTDATYKAAMDAFLDSKIKEAELQKEYYQKFQKVLPIKKVFKLSSVEVDFMQKVISEHKRERHNNKK